jgi:hypothetical protein
VTDYAEEMEILSTGNELEAAIVAIRNKQAQKTAEKLARERELAKVGQPLKQVGGTDSSRCRNHCKPYGRC